MAARGQGVPLLETINRRLLSLPCHFKLFQPYPYFNPNNSCRLWLSLLLSVHNRIL